jgi:hypothetical protein
MYSSTLSLTLALDGVGAQSHVPAALPIVLQAGWAPGPVWTGEENFKTGKLKLNFIVFKEISLRTQKYSGYPSLGHNNFGQ